VSSSCTLTSSIDSPEVKEFIKRKLTQKVTEAVSEDVTVSTDPFNCLVVKNFLKNPEFLEELRLECDNLKLTQKNNDLYKFHQSAALSDNAGTYIQELRTKLLQQMRTWIMECLELELDAGSLDLFCAKYRHTDTLLCHDDELEERKVAFILYLTEDAWSEADGGMLELFDTDEKGNPDKVVRRLLPEGNSFALFEVSPVSFHTVSEVLSETKTRLSLSGWFHGKVPARAKREPPPSVAASLPQELDEAEFYRWLNPAYLDPETQSDIQTQFEESSEISLSGFLPPELYSELSQALASHKQWSLSGPPDRRRCQTIQGDLPDIVAKCQQFFTSDAFFLLLSNLTGLKLHQLAPEDSDSEEDKEDGAEKEEKVYNPRCRGGLARWGPGNYTLIRDDDQEQAEYALDLRICFNVSSGEESEAGGQSVYIARGEDEELVTVTPEENTLSLVYRDKESLKFIKYVNSRLEKPFHDLQITYYE